MKLFLCLILLVLPCIAENPSCPQGEILVYQRANAQSKPEPICKRGISAQKPGRVLLYTGSAYKGEDLSKVLELIKSFEQKPEVVPAITTTCSPTDSKAIAGDIIEYFLRPIKAYGPWVLGTFVAGIAVWQLHEFGARTRERMGRALSEKRS